MAIANMNELFDKLQEYIDKKIEGVEGGLKELFDEYELKAILPYLNEIKTVADNLEIIIPVGSNITSIVKVAGIKDEIIAVPAEVDRIEFEVARAESLVTKSHEYVESAHNWAQENHGVVVEDGDHIGYSSFHWAIEARDAVYQITWRGGWDPTSGSKPIPNAHGDYWLVTRAGQYNNTEVFYAGDWLIWYDGGDGPAQWIHKKEAVHWLQIVGKPAMFTPKPHMHSEYVKKENLVPYSTGSTEAGYPIKLWVDGTIHNSMIKLPVTYIVGEWTPGPSDEYPDLTDHTTGASWLIHGVPVASGYTFFEGDLAARKVRNGDVIIYSKEGWIIQYDKLLPETYLKRSGEYPMWGDLQMNTNKITGLEDGVEDDDAATIGQLGVVTEDVYTKDEYLPFSQGVDDAGKPIVLNRWGLVDPSMIAFTSLNPVGDWDPDKDPNNEYPPFDSNTEPGSMWYIYGVDTTLGYTFKEGDLKDRTVYNGDWIVRGQDQWFAAYIQIQPEDFYRLDGTNPLTSDFNTGGYKISRIADAIEDDDATSKLQVETMILSRAPLKHTHTIDDIPHGPGSGLDADTLDGMEAADFASQDHIHNPGDISPQGDSSGLDADMVDGKHADEFRLITDHIDWTEVDNKPTAYPPVKSNEMTVGGLRIWNEGDALHIANTEYVAP